MRRRARRDDGHLRAAGRWVGIPAGGGGLSGPAGCPGCSEAVAALLRSSPLHFTVSYIGPHEKRTLTAVNLRGVDQYAQPGGDGSVAQTMRSLGPAAARVIKPYAGAGGHYLGFCVGAYLAGSAPGLGLLALGDTGQYVQTPGSQ